MDSTVKWVAVGMHLSYDSC